MANLTLQFKTYVDKMITGTLGMKVFLFDKETV